MPEYVPGLRALAYSLNPGREADGVIAEKVLGYRREIVPKDGAGENGGNEYLVPAALPKDYQLPPKGPIGFAFHAPRVTTEWRDAYALWMRLAGAGWRCSLVHEADPDDPEAQWEFDGSRRDDSSHTSLWWAGAATPEMAISRGALLSLMEDEA